MPGQVRGWFKVRFITGFFVIVPVILTAYVLWIFFREVDGFLSPVYEQVVGRPVPGLGFLTAVVIIFLIGVVATNVVGRRVLWWGEWLLRRVPIFGRVYHAVKDLMDAFSPQRRSGFREFVIVEHPREGTYTYGFRTGEVRVEGTKPESLVTVYVPTNHLYLGDIILVAAGQRAADRAVDRGRHPDRPLGRDLRAAPASGPRTPGQRRRQVRTR